MIKGKWVKIIIKKKILNYARMLKMNLNPKRIAGIY